MIAGYQSIWNGFGEKDTTLEMVKLLYKLIFFFPALYLFRFSNKMEVALNSSNQELITASLVNLKSFFRFLGIFTVIFLIVGTIGILVIDLWPKCFVASSNGIIFSSTPGNRCAASF
ncbi:hypothetical protein DXT99_22550 [Pontibacter diazotrophicus]|uniref:Uncharacterized protein n=1 Tax=Pontibacter diazotrophicus TaxID=1400979 RepID=A0A3D8L4V8_9BACT|nr:hypothetical protein DXT99_22550 [Pontibacter diazotrophicus]